MSQEAMCPLYPYSEEEKMEIRRELGLKESDIEDDIDFILDWFQKQPHLVDAGIDRAFIERMLIMSKGSREQTKQRIDSYYKYRALAPEIIQDREKILSESQDLWRSYFQFAVPQLYKGYRISITGLLHEDPSVFHPEAHLKNTFMLSDLRMQYDYFLGDIWILDMKHASFGHLLRVHPMIVQKAALMFHEGLNLKLQAIHIINATSLLQPAMSFLKPFFSQKVFDRIKVHNSLEDLQKEVPKMYLPKDYGGEQPSVLEFKDMYEKELRESKTKQFLIAASKIISDETKRPNADLNEDYLSGSFRSIYNLY